MKKILLILLVLSGVSAGCQHVEVDIVNGGPESQRVKKDSVWAVSIQAAREAAPGTKGLAIGDNADEATTKDLRSVWNANEPVYVFLGSECIGTLKATPQADPHHAILSGEVAMNGITPGVTSLTLRTLREAWEYTGQVGKLLVGDDPDNPGEANRSIENRFHYSLAGPVLVTDATVDNEGKGTLVTENASFSNQQSIYRMSFRFQKNGTGDKYAIDAKRIWITAAGGGLVQSLGMDGSPVTGAIDVILDEATPNPFFVALRNNNTTDEEALSFRVMDSEGITYCGSKTIPSQYKPNGTFVSMKNATLTERLGVTLNTGTGITVENAM